MDINSKPREIHNSKTNCSDILNSFCSDLQQVLKEWQAVWQGETAREKTPNVRIYLEMVMLSP